MNHLKLSEISISKLSGRKLKQLLSQYAEKDLKPVSKQAIARELNLDPQTLDMLIKRFATTNYGNYFYDFSVEHLKRVVAKKKLANGKSFTPATIEKWMQVIERFIVDRNTGKWYRRH